MKVLRVRFEHPKEWQILGILRYGQQAHSPIRRYIKETTQVKTSALGCVFYAWCSTFTALIYSGFPLHTLDVSYIILINVHQGPALYAYNNAEFTKEDWKGIRMLCDSIKVKDPMKVGRFGLGFKSVFHITGEITIIYLPDLD